MRDCFVHAVRLSIVLTVIVGGTRAQAGTIHAFAQVIGGGLGDSQLGETSASANSTLDLGGTELSGSAFSTGAGGVFVSASLHSTDFNSTIQSGASWTDQVHLSGQPGVLLPDLLDFYFTASGAIGRLGPYASATFTVAASGDQGGTGGTHFYGIYYNDGRGVGVDTLFGSVPWDTIVYDDHSFFGTYHIQVGLRSDFAGGIVGDWNVGYSAALNRQGDVNGNDPPRFSFDAVRLPDGRTPEEAGLSLTFDSGIASPNAAAVPEPSSLTLLASGGLAILVCARRHRGGAGTQGRRDERSAA